MIRVAPASRRDLVLAGIGGRVQAALADQDIASHATGAGRSRGWVRSGR